MMGKLRIGFSLLLICLITISPLLVTVNHVNAHGSGTNVPSKLIKQDTTWTLAGSPYTLTGKVGVVAGVTLMLEPGVTVNVGSYELTVNGTLIAQGTSDKPIYINWGESAFSTLTLNAFGGSTSPDSSSVFEHVIFSNYGVSVSGGSPEFKNCQLVGLSIWSGSPLVEDNTVTGSIFIYNDAAQILNNLIEGTVSIQGGTPTIKGNTITTTNTYGASGYGEGEWGQKYYGIQIVPTGSSVTSATVQNNTIATGIYCSGMGASKILNNSINGGLVFGRGGATVSGNSISGGISILSGGGGYVIKDNVISNGPTAGIYMQQGQESQGIFDWTHGPNTALIERNRITGSKYGLQLSDYATVKNNTISCSDTAFYLQNAQATINYNNIGGFTQNSVYIEYGGADVNATYNWWGTADEQAISRTIHDSKYDYDLGTVNYVPLLTVPNPEAIPDLNVPTSILNPEPSTSTAQPTTQTSTTQPPQTSNPIQSQNPTSTPQNPVNQPVASLNLNVVEVAIFAVLVVIAVLLVFAVFYLRKRVLYPADSKAVAKVFPAPS